MTPQERQLIDELFGRLAGLESAPRDADAARAIADGQRRAPNAIYALVQTVLLQDEALRRANERIEELEGRAGIQNQQPGSFLDSMRDSIFGGGSARGSVPNVRPSDGGRASWNTGGTGVFDRAAPPPLPGAPQQQGGGGGSFLGTAAAAAAGVVGGSLLLNSIRGMMGGGSQQGFRDQASLDNKSLGGAKDSPWGGQSSNNESGTGGLARDAGIDNIGKQGNEQRTGLFDDSNTRTADNSDYDDGDDDGFDGDDGFDSDDA